MSERSQAASSAADANVFSNGSDMPQLVFARIAEHVDSQTLLAMSLVCKAWHSCYQVMFRPIWKVHLARHHGLPVSLLDCDNLTDRQLQLLCLQVPALPQHLIFPEKPGTVCRHEHGDDTFSVWMDGGADHLNNSAVVAHHPVRGHRSDALNAAQLVCDVDTGRFRLDPDFTYFEVELLEVPDGNVPFDTSEPSCVGLTHDGTSLVNCFGSDTMNDMPEITVSTGFDVVLSKSAYTCEVVEVDTEEAWAPGDTIGIGLDHTLRRLFVTAKGKLLIPPVQAYPLENVYPIVEISKSIAVRFNFGHRPFSFQWSKDKLEQAVLSCNDGSECKFHEICCGTFYKNAFDFPMAGPSARPQDASACQDNGAACNLTLRDDYVAVVEEGTPNAIARHTVTTSFAWDGARVSFDYREMPLWYNRLKKPVAPSMWRIFDKSAEVISDSEGSDYDDYDIDASDFYDDEYGEELFDLNPWTKKTGSSTNSGKFGSSAGQRNTAFDRGSDFFNGDEDGSASHTSDDDYDDTDGEKLQQAPSQQKRQQQNSARRPDVSRKDWDVPDLGASCDLSWRLDSRPFKLSVARGMRPRPEDEEEEEDEPAMNAVLGHMNLPHDVAIQTWATLTRISNNFMAAFGGQEPDEFD